MQDEMTRDATQRMAKCVAQLRDHYRKMRTGRANVGLLEGIKVEYYGSEMPINQVASISVEDARTLVISPWDKGAVQAVEKAILKSDLGLTPNTAGQVIRLPLPPIALALMALAFVVPGLAGHDLWKSHDAIGLGIVNDMAKRGELLLPRVSGLIWLNDPPLYHWVALAFGGLLQRFLEFHAAARLASGAFVLAALWFIYRAARGWIPAEDRATTASGALLLLLGSVGLTVHLTDTYFVVAHFHYVMVGGQVIAYLGGIHYWWPKMTGKMYSEFWGKISAMLVFDAHADQTDTWNLAPCAVPVCGDCTGDGVVSILDALAAAQHSAGLSVLVGPRFTACNVFGALGAVHLSHAHDHGCPIVEHRPRSFRSSAVAAVGLPMDSVRPSECSVLTRDATTRIRARPCERPRGSPRCPVGRGSPDSSRPRGSGRPHRSGTRWAREAARGPPRSHPRDRVPLPRIVRASPRRGT